MPKRVYICEKCGQSFTTEESARHCEERHSEMVDFKCPKCKAVWTDRHPLICPQCGTSLDSGIICQLCEGFVRCDTYGEGNCESCGQRYEYNEALMIVLTDSQQTILRDAKENQ